MQFANECRRNALVLMAEKPNGPMNAAALTWLRLAILEDCLAIWAVQVERIEGPLRGARRPAAAHLRDNC
jgi:hypothetical protein